MSTYNKELSNDQEIETVLGIKFSVLSPEEIARRSVVEVTKNDTFAGSEPVVGGLFDPRMGIIETNKTCATCQQKNLFCPGHFGHINLARPIFHPMFFDTVRKLLKCVCYRCSRPLVSSRSTRDDIKSEVQRINNTSNQQKRWEALLKFHSKVKLKRCGDDMKTVSDDEEVPEGLGCKALQPSRYQKESSGMKIHGEWREAGMEATTNELTADDVLRILKRITENDMKLMGFDPRWNKPEWMICTVLPVPPPSVRPSIIEDSGQRREDDLTHKLCDIIKYNNQLKQRIESGKATEDNLKLLTGIIQYHVATFMDNQIPGMPQAQQRNGRKMKSIADRLKKKEGRIRGNLNGKRVDQSARSVITPDPNISLDELGVPLRIAMNLTFPEVVNMYNKEFLQSLVRAGVDTWPGAKYVRRAADGVTIALKYANRDKIADELQHGDTVDRHMMNGDYVLFNRQPSLHKMSMMGFKVRVMSYQTFRLPVLSTGCFNADFDGDEMNLFKPQNVQTMSEIVDLAAIPYLIINPRDAKPIVEVIQDTMVGSYRITKDWTYINDKTIANLQMVNSYFTGSMPTPQAEDVARGAFTGKQAFSMMFPPGLFINMKNKTGELFRVENSQIVSGTVDKSVYHSMSKGIIPVLFHDYGPFEARRFLDNTQRLMCRWLMTGGFSVGISDIVVPKETTDKIKMTISEYKRKAYVKFMDMRKGTFDNASILNNEDNFEREILNVLNALNKELGRVALDERSNRMINMIKSGSKGKEENVAQMVAAVGQQNVDGKRVAYGFTDRTLPHYTKYDDGPEARGFVENSFINGLTPQEVFFHAMGGREGLIDTAVKTSETGYIQRRLVKAMEDAKVYYDQTIRNATGAVVQYLYGEDGMDGTKIENQFLPYIGMNIIEMDTLYHLRPEDPLDLYLTEEARSNLGDWYGRTKHHFHQLIEDRLYIIKKVFKGHKQDKIQYPIPFERIIYNAMSRLGAAANMPTDLTPLYILDKIEELIDKLYIIHKNQGIMFLHVLLRLHLSPKLIIMRHNMSRPIFDWVVAEIERYFVEAIVHSCDMSGIIAAQSIGELGTQQTLDSFHSSGTAAAVKATSGVPRLKELLNVSKNIKTPTMFIYMQPDIGTVVNPVDDEKNKDPRVQEAKERSLVVKRQLEVTRIVDILDTTEIYWDPPGADGLHTGVDGDSGMMDIYRAFSAIDQSACRSNSPWVLRVKINREKLYKIGLTMMDIYMRLNIAYQNMIDCLYSDDNANELVFRIRLKPDALKDVDTDDTIAALKAMEYNIVNGVLLKGVKGIKKVAMRPVSSQVYNDETDQFDTRTEWILDTDGTNLQEILANPNIDATRTRSNDVYEIFNTLGIEAARNVLHQEFTEVVGEGALNYRHMSLLLDTMTNRGSLMSIDRHGINRGDIGPLAKSSFEETTDMLIDASIFSQNDKINGVSANIMLGQVPPCGTGDQNIFIDEGEYTRLMKEYKDKHASRGVSSFVNGVATPSGEESKVCQPTSLAFSFKLPEKQQNQIKLPTVVFK